MKNNYAIITHCPVLNNFRVEQFPGFQFYAIVITARCDIANCKVSKFYYLKAAPIDIWAKTEGLRLALEKIYIKKLKEVLQYWEGRLPEYNELFGKSLDYIKNIISSNLIIILTLSVRINFQNMTAGSGDGGEGK